MSPYDPSSDTLARERRQASATGEVPQAAAAPLVNGPAAAAILAAGIGALALGVFAFTGDQWPAVNRFFTFYLPTGPLSGVTTSAIAVWLVVWFGFARRWRAKTVAVGKVNLAAFAALAIGILLTFPPFADLLHGIL